MSVLTNKHYINVIQNLINDLVDSKNNYYAFIGRPYPWEDDNNPPSAVNTYQEYEQSIYHDIAYGKLIDIQDLSFMIPKYNWTINTIYAQYDQNDPDLFDKQFFVINDSNQVYKCISNNRNSQSTVKPFLTIPSGTFNTGDGYTWKYMYTVDVTSLDTFGTSTYIPITPDANVVSSSIPGTIDTIGVTFGGTNYQTYTEGVLQSFIDEYSVQIANTASNYDNFYTDSSIYMKGGLGSGQIRKIKSYSGASNLLTVYDPFDLFVSLNVSNVSGTIEIGQTVEQRTDSIAYLYQNGFFNPQDIVVQSDTGAIGSILSANTSVLSLFKISNTSFDIVNNTPLFNTSQGGVLNNGLVNISVGNNYVMAVSGTSFTTDYKVDQYIRVGVNANTNVRRITAVNSSVITVSVPFYYNLISNNHYSTPYAVEPTSLTVIDSTGTITGVNLDSMSVSYDTSSSPDITFIIGEKVKLESQSGIDEMANATVSTVNSSVIILNEMQGTFAANLYIVGQSSTLTARIASLDTYPNITISTATSHYITGQPFNVLYANGLITANATLLTSTSTPGTLTEYVISPTVNIVGDGVDALAYSVANTSVTSPNEITEVVMINSGTNYTYANVYLEANGLYGSNAVVSPIISPILGHGFDPLTELGARYLGISMFFDTAANELYKFPAYGNYRRVGIIKNPQFNDVYVNVNGFSQVNLNITNKSSNTYIVGEFVLQPNTNSCGKVVSSNSSYMQLSSVQGEFIYNSNNDNIIGLTSGTTANVLTANVNYFSISANVESISDGTSYATGNIVQIVDQNDIRLSNVVGIISKNDTLVDLTSNTYATVNSIFVSNGTVEVTQNFGVRFNQTGRLSLSSNSGSFSNNEYVFQTVTNASGRIISDSDELDFIFTPVNGVFSRGLTVTNANTGANGVITFANSTYLKVITNNKWYLNDPISTISANGVVTGIYNVLRLNDVNGTFQSQDVITGNTSGAIGYCNFPNTIEYPDLIKNTGEVIYINDILPIQKTLDSNEEVAVIIKF